MNFTSLEFSIFFAIFFVIYWFVVNNNLKNQNILILVASYIFYGWWDWRFLSLIFISSLVDFFIGKFLMRTDDPIKRKRLFYISLGVNLGFLGFFKYFNFFIDTFKTALHIVHIPEHFSTLDIILPIGISFYTLQTLSYTFDVYDRKIKATDDFVSFFAYVSFFPQLVAGPIERAGQLLPQFYKKRTFSYDKAADGLRQVVWGLFKKMVIADNCAPYAGKIIAHSIDYSASSLLLAIAMGTFQLYCDFSGYSDIAIGTARILGFDLMKNFNFPFFSRNMAEFWQKWHISLITWFRDYVIKRLKGFSKYKLARNIFVIFLITGFWHGANWTFIFWGFLHALLFLPLIFIKRKRYRGVTAKGKLFPSFKELFLMIRTFYIFGTIGIFFMSTSIHQGVRFIKNMFSFSIFEFPVLPPIEACLAIIFLLIVEWLQREKEHGLELKGLKIPGIIRWTFYVSLVFVILTFSGRESDFVYFQF